MSTATQAFNNKVSFSVTPITFETFHPALKKSTINQNLCLQEAMSFVDPSPRALENNSVTVIHVPASGQ